MGTRRRSGKVNCVKNGLVFGASETEVTLADEGKSYMLIEVGDHKVSLGYTFGASGKFKGRIYEGPTGVTGGSPIEYTTNLNKHFSSTDGVTITVGVSASGLGTGFAGVTISGGSSVFSRVGGQVRASWILKANTDYLVEIENDSGASGWYTFAYQWEKC